MRAHASRRQFMAGASLLAMELPVAKAIGSDLHTGVADLRTDYLTSPLGLDNRRPLLSWRLTGRRRGIRQTSYRIRVAGSLEALRAGKADLWDSGQVESNRNLAIAYEGAPLVSRQICFWQVEIWDDQGVRSVSTPAQWEMGLLESSDWQADWIVAEDAAMRADREVGLVWVGGNEAGPRLFRYRFNVATASQMTLITYLAGPYRVWLDGEEMDLPPFSALAFGGRPATTFAKDISAGSHMLLVAAQPFAGLFAGIGAASDVNLGAFLKLQGANGRVDRISTLAWETMPGAAEDALTRAQSDSGWSAGLRKAKLGASFADDFCPWPPQASVLMRRAFDVTKPVARARLYATALGAYDAHLNGAKIGDAILAPECTDFSKRITYRAYDVTTMLRPGANLIGAQVADGWYGSYVAPRGRFGFGPPPRRYFAQLEILYADGTRQSIVTDANWRVTAGPVISAEIYNGETYDARAEISGWDTAGFNAAGWEQAIVGVRPLPALNAQVSPPIRAIQLMRAKLITSPRAGVHVFDFGQNFAGWARLRVRGAAGQEVTLRFAEVIKKDGNIDQSNLRAAADTDRYILRGAPKGENFEPHFTYRGFRYVEVSGYPGIPTADDVQGVVAHSDLAETGTLRTDNAIINGIWHNALWSQRSNFFGLPTDCPQRDERLGWMGDANVFWPAAAYNMDVDAFTRRFMDTVRDSQYVSGGFAPISPNTVGPIGAGASPGWADAGVTLPYTVWRQYGDTGIIDANWAAMDRYLDMILGLNPDLIWRKGREADFGDWLSYDGKAPGDPTTPKDLLSTAVWAHSMACMIEMAAATGRSADHARLSDLHRRQKDAFNAAFVRADGSIGNDSQTGYIIALRYDLVPENLRAKSAALLAANIVRRGTLLTTGFLGTPNSLDVLADAGQEQLVYDLLLRTTYPSWGYMVAHGATTMWERWNGDTGDVSMNSFNHYAFGAVGSFLYRRIAGIAAIQPGFSEIAIAPVLDPRVKQGGADYDSVMGRISTDWHAGNNGEFSITITVPPNSSATVTLPAAAGQSIFESGRDAAKAEGLTALSRDHSAAVFRIGGGSYNFQVR